VANVAALSLYAWSWLARRGGRRGAGITLGLLGASAATAGGYLGGHLVYRQGVGADRNAWKHGGDDWVDVADDLALVDGKPLVVKVDDDDVLLAKTPAGVIAAMSNVCGHAGGPLNEGEFDSEGCVTCPWHGSVFRLADGHVVHGPATGHQPRYDVRSEGGRLSVRRLRSPA
jgi:nitrite reductase/ring-hydroxylating ferredoxin subunit